MERRTFLGAVGGVGLLGGGVVAYELFAPEQATEKDDDRTTGDGTEVLKTGTFTGKAGHECSGSVELVADGDGHLLQFRDYEQTQGPDVYCYLCPAEDPDESDEIAAGRKIRMDDGEGDGEMTLTGTFAQRLPDDADVDAADGIGIWCDDFSTPFGAATLSSGEST